MSDPVTARAPRLLSLDIFRGMTIAGMILVNDPGNWGAIYPPLRHAEWNGWTPTDLIFPFFLFIVGVSMTFSFGKTLARGATRADVFRRSAKRAAIIVLLGLILGSFPWIGYNFAHIRFPGVLQRIGVAFLLAAPVLLWTGRRGRAAVTVTLLLGYWAAMTLIPVPGSGAGVLEPGKDLGAWLDRAIFGVDHLWKQSRTWDPEGLLSTLPAVATVLLGTYAGDWLRSDRTGDRKTVGLVAAGVIGTVVGLAWHPFFPINKALWTSSYVVFSAGMALLVLSLCYWLADVRGHRRWGRPFEVFGVNAIAVFFMSNLVELIINRARVGDISLKRWLNVTLLDPYLAPKSASLAWAIVVVLFWLAAMWVLYRKRIYIKI